MKKNKSNQKSAGTKASSKAKATSKVVANTRLVAAIRAADAGMKQAQSLLVTMAEICQSEDLTRPEVVASIMEARAVEKSTAESQYSRMKKLLTDPTTLEALRSGEISLKAAREATTKKQNAPSAEKKKASAEKRFVKAISTVVEMAKETGMDRSSVVKTLTSALKKGGVK